MSVAFSSCLRRLPCLCAVLICGAILLASTVPGWGQTVTLQPGQGIADLRDALSFHVATETALPDAVRLHREGAFTPDIGAVLEPLSGPGQVWMAVEIDNDTIDDGRPQDLFAATFSLAQAEALDVYLIRQGGFTENLLNHSAKLPFVAEDHAVTRLRTPEFGIAPQERVLLLARVDFGPIRTFHVALKTPVELQASAFADGVRYTAFYAFGIACLVFFFGFQAAMKNWTGFAYASLFAVALVFIAHIDGLLFRFLFPQMPDWQTLIERVLLFGLSAAGLLIAGRSLRRDGRETGASVALTCLAALPVLTAIGAERLSEPHPVLAGAVLLAVVLCICVWASLGRWLAETSGGGRPALAVLLGLLLAGLLGAVAMASGVMPAPRLLVPDMAKIVFAVTLLATMTSLTVHIIGLRRRHAQAVELQIAALEEEAKRSQELLVAEQNYARARDLASLRQKQLATASHDLKQPLASLRMTFSTLAQDTPPEVAHRLNEALAYLEDLSAEYLRETMPSAGDDAADGADAADQPAPAPEAVEGEIYDLSIILETVQRMFNEEAISKGLQLRVVPTSLRIAVPAIVMMRIVSNLASNAVKYTERGRVLIGVRRRQAEDRMWAAIEVIDTGPGISAPDLERLFDPYEKGEQSQGHGLGLAVCRELAAQNGLRLTVDSEPGRGTCMRLLVPVMPQAT